MVENDTQSFHLLLVHVCEIMSKYVEYAISWNPKLTGQKNSDPFTEAL